MCIERTGEEGILYNSPDKPGPIKRVANDFKKSIQYKKQINTEAKNYVSRVESEVRAKFAKGTESHGEHH